MNTLSKLAVAMVFFMAIVATCAASGVYDYTGTNIAGLNSLINADGDGTYILHNEITVSSTWTVPRGNIILQGPSKLSSYDTGKGGCFRITMASGDAITCVQSFDQFKNCNFYLTNTANNVNILNFWNPNTAWQIYDWVTDCSFLAGTGSAIRMKNMGYVFIDDCEILGPGSSSGFGVYLEGNNLPYINQGLINRFNVGICMNGGTLCVDGTQVDNCYDAIYAYDGASTLADIIVSNAVFDFCTNVGVQIAANNPAQRLRFYNTHIWCQGTSSSVAMTLQNGYNVLLDGCWLGTQSSWAGALWLDNKNSKVDIANSHFEASSGPGINIVAQSGSSINKNINIDGGTMQPGNGVAINIGSGANTVTVTNTRRTGSINNAGTNAYVDANTNKVLV